MQITRGSEVQQQGYRVDMNFFHLLQDSARGTKSFENQCPTKCNTISSQVVEKTSYAYQEIFSLVDGKKRKKNVKKWRLARYFFEQLVLCKWQLCYLRALRYTLTVQQLTRLSWHPTYRKLHCSLHRVIPVKP